MTMLVRLLTLAIALASASAASAAPALWQVSDGNSKIWLFGSFHVLPPTIEWRTETFDRVLAAADRVYFETDVGSDAQVAILSSALKIGLNPLGTTLSSQLQPDDADALRSTIADMQLSTGAVQVMKPWLATMTISSALLTQGGYDPNSGVDILLQKELPAERKAYFETGDQQLGFLASAPQTEQVEMLNETIRRLDEYPAQIDAMVNAWADGTPERLKKVFAEELAGYEDFGQRLIYDRNRTWATRIDAMLADDEQDLIVVGAGHLIGDGSVVDLLQEQGYRVKRLQ